MTYVSFNPPHLQFNNYTKITRELSIQTNVFSISVELL